LKHLAGYIPLRVALTEHLTKIGQPLLKNCVVHDQQLGRLHNELAAHELANSTVLRLDLFDVLEVPPVWSLEGLNRSLSERKYMHIIRLISLAINGDFHDSAREALAEFVLDGEGVMARGNDAEFRLTSPKSIARMKDKCNSWSDHRRENGCRPALNIDALRLLAVAQTSENLFAAAHAIAVKYGGVLRAENGFAAADAPAEFGVRAVVLNVIFRPGYTLGQLRSRPEVQALWQSHILSEPEGGQPRGRWQAEAQQAYQYLMGEDIAEQDVAFIGEIQLMLASSFRVRKQVTSCWGTELFSSQHQS
jgi:hypothetical protein